MNEFLSSHFYIYFKIDGYVAAVLSKECAQAERGMPRYDKNLDPHSLFPPRCKASAISDAKVCCRTYPLGNHSPTHRYLCSRFSLAISFLLHLSRPLTRESLGNVCVKIGSKLILAKKMSQLVCVLRHCLLIPLQYINARIGVCLLHHSFICAHVKRSSFPLHSFPNFCCCSALVPYQRTSGSRTCSR